MSLLKMILKAAVPIPQLEAFERVLFVGPHPDDIEIGAGLIQETGLEDRIAHCRTY